MEPNHNENHETAQEFKNQNIDSGLACLVIAARLLGIPADYQQLIRTFAITDTADTATLLRVAKK